MARAANPNKDAIDGLRNEAKELLSAHKTNTKTIKQATKDNGKHVASLVKINTKLEKFGVAPVALPEDAEPVAAPAAPVKAARGNGAAKVASTTAAPVGRPVVKSAKGAGKAPEAVTTAPKRGRKPRAEAGTPNFD